MKNFLKSNKGFTIKELIFTIIAIIISFSIGFALAYVFINNESDKLPDQVQQIQDNQNENEEEEEEEINEEMEEPTTKEILMDSYDSIAYITSNFDYEWKEDEEQSEIENYKEVMEETFTENGQKIFENENKETIEIKNGKAYISLKKYENTGEYLFDINFENIKETKDTITATAIRTMSKKEVSYEYGEENPNIETYELKDEFVLKKVNDNWLIDKYSWVVPGL